MKKILIGFGIFIIIFIIYFLHGHFKIQSVSKGEKISKYNNPQKAILIIDLQRDITEKDGRVIMNLKQTDKIIENINKILANNKHGLTVIYIIQEWEDNFILKLVTKGALQHGDPKTDIDPRIKIVSKNQFIKHIADAFSNPDLDKFLIMNRVDHLYITGIDAEYCVDKTVKAALNRNYKISIIKDAIGSRTDEKRDNKIKEFSKLGAEIISTDQLLKNL